MKRDKSRSETDFGVYGSLRGSVTISKTARTLWFMVAALKIHEFNYLQWLEGNLSDDLWAGSRAGLVAQFVYQQVYERNWPSASSFYSSRFQALVNKEIIPEARAMRAKAYRDNPDQVVPPEPAPATDAPR